MDIDRATAYIRARGTMIDKARMASILRGEKTDPLAVHALERMQNPDGGFSYWLPQKNISTVCDTVYILSWIADLVFDKERIVTAAIRFLFSHQKSDGGWDEVRAIDDPPEFLIAGRTATRVWLTAYCAHWLMRFGYAKSPLCAGCPVDFLLRNRESNGRLIGYLRATWDALPVFNVFPEGDRKPFKDALRVAVEEFTPEQWSGSYLAWLLRCLRDAKIDGSDSFAKKVLSELVKKQRQDGSWDSEDGEDYTVSATLESIQALKDFGLISPSHRYAELH